MALNAQEQALFDFACEALPAWFTSDERVREELAAAAVAMAAAQAAIVYWFQQTLISHATGATPSTPDWLNQHAHDRNTRRQANESDPALRDRLRNVPEALIRASLLAATNAILAAEGIAGTAAMLETPRDGGHWGRYTKDSGVGGTFTKSGTTTKFTPTARWLRPPYRHPEVVPHVRHRLDVTGALSAANNGQFEVTGLEDDAALYENAGGVAQVDAGVTWTVTKLDVAGNVTDGFGRFYWGRGYRYSKSRPGRIIIILPFGASDATAASVREMLRQKKAAGIAATVEIRRIP